MTHALSRPGERAGRPGSPAQGPGVIRETPEGTALAPAHCETCEPWAWKSSFHQTSECDRSWIFADVMKDSGVSVAPDGMGPRGQREHSELTRTPFMPDPPQPRCQHPGWQSGRCLCSRAKPSVPRVPLHCCVTWQNRASACCISGCQVLSLPVKPVCGYS